MEKGDDNNSAIIKGKIGQKILKKNGMFLCYKFTQRS